MITLSFLKYLEDNGFGVIDESLFWQKMGIDKKGLYISSIGGVMGRGVRRIQNFELYSRGTSQNSTSDVEAAKKLESVIDFLEDNDPVCTLPEVPPIHSHTYRNVTVEVTSPLMNMGLDSNGRVIYSITGRIIY